MRHDALTSFMTSNKTWYYLTKHDIKSHHITWFDITYHTHISDSLCVCVCVCDVKSCDVNHIASKLCVRVCVCVLSCHIMPYHIMLCVMSYHIMLCYATTHHIAIIIWARKSIILHKSYECVCVSCHIMSYFMSGHIMLCYATNLI